MSSKSITPRTNGTRTRAPYTFLGDARLGQWTSATKSPVKSHHLPPIVPSAASDRVPATVQSKSKPTTLQGSTMKTPRRDSVAAQQAASFMIPGREPCTSDLAAFDAYVATMRNMQRPTGAPGFSQEFWAKMREQLATLSGALGWADVGDEEGTQYRSRDDIGAMIGRVQGVLPLLAMSAKVVARTFGLDSDIALNEFLFATHVGLCSMRFGLRCVQCTGSVERAGLLKDVPLEGDCAQCGFHNKTNLLDSIQATFDFASEVLYAPAKNAGCMVSSTAMANTVALVPVLPTVSGSGYRFTFGVNDESSGPALPRGRYVLRCPAGAMDCLFEVCDDAPEDASNVCQVTIRNRELSSYVERQKTVVSVPHGRVTVDMHADRQSLVIFWVMRQAPDQLWIPEVERRPYTAASELVVNPVFEVLYRKQIVPSGETSTVEATNVVLVFTDIVSSTNLYASLGDAVALALVQKHFRVLFECISAAGGRVVKTVGDAVMAAFPSPTAAVAAMLSALPRIRDECTYTCPDGTVGHVRLRVGCHRGPSVVVPVNGVNDYFGQTVNITARVEGKASPMSMLLTSTILDDEKVSHVVEAAVQSRCYTLSDTKEYELKGVAGTWRGRVLQLHA